jgi:hypothetical protein
MSDRFHRTNKGRKPNRRKIKQYKCRGRLNTQDSHSRGTFYHPRTLNTNNERKLMSLLGGEAWIFTAGHKPYIFKDSSVPFVQNV